ncbi:hypothetical protein [Sporofaciens musculi]|uniref:hypothetical protein n=1 Tax=Sporofaciens musculi TaxID=2681861 RepID=UPI0025A20271|nr:hypothetical protein [Sporofaciens musculi]
MVKKNPYVFTIGFDETNPGHVRAVEILNGTKKKAQLIASSVLSYVDGVDSKRPDPFLTETLQPLLEKIVQKELEKVMSIQPVSGNGVGLEQSENLSPEEGELPMDEYMTQSIINAMDAFRRNE